jgi:hypothetical protein
VATTAGAANRFRVGEGEEARLTPGSAFAAEIRSRGPLPLRARREALHHARPAFPGTAVVIGEAAYEVVAEREPDAAGSVLYGLQPWRDGEIFRERVVYGPAFVRAVEAERNDARLRARVRPWRFLLYPVVGLLPEEQQVRVCERLGLYAVTATLASGLLESAVVLGVLLLVGRNAEAGMAIALVVAAPGLVLFVLPGLGRAFAAALLQETGGSPVVNGLVQALQAAGALAGRPPAGFVPLTRAEFWARLACPDTLETEPDRDLLLSGMLPHLDWDASRRLQAGSDYWRVEPQPPRLEGPRLVYAYRLVPLGDPEEPGEPGPTAPAPTAYADEVLGGVRLEWDAFNSGFAWLTSLLASEVQSRAFEHRGGPAAVRRATLATAAASAALGAYLLHFLPGPPGDPLAPAIAVAGVLLLADAARRWRAARGSRYAPSLLRWLLPSNVLRPERLAFHAHRDAERDALLALRGR